MSKTYKATCTDYCSCSQVICLWFKGDGFLLSYFKWNEVLTKRFKSEAWLLLYFLFATFKMQLFIFNLLSSLQFANNKQFYTWPRNQACSEDVLLQFGKIYVLSIY